MKFAPKIYLLWIIILLFIACSGSLEKNNSEKGAGELINQAGKVVDEVTCRSNANYSYCLYLPGGFDSNKKYPLIIVFDAHARGKMAVERFKEAADSYGYIIVASNEARNGIQDINPIVNAIWDDVVNRFPIDNSRIYTAGFSGGARIAASVAVYKGGVKGVIGCGGGMPSPSQELKSKFDFISIVGLNDLNYQELKTLDKALSDNGFVCQMLTFNGGHEWPDSKTISKAVEWLDIMAIKQKLLPVNDNLVRNYSSYYADTINKLIKLGESYKAYLFYNIILKDLGGIYDIAEYQKSYDALLKDPKIDQNIKLSEKLKTEELSKQEQVISWFKTSSFSQLKNEVKRLQKLANNDNKEQMHQVKRIMGYMGMLSFLYTESALKSQNKENYEGFMEIYELLEPINPDISFFKACQAIMDKQPDKAIEYLKKSIELGFYDSNRLQTIGYFEELRARPEFDLLVIKSNENFNNQK
jgi:dienelactone hydrolase